MMRVPPDQDRLNGHTYAATAPEPPRVENRVGRPNEAASPADRYASWILAAIMLVALVTRIADLGAASLWLDEIWSIGIARLPWRTFFWTVQNQDPNMSVYYALLHVWLNLGDGEFAVRSLSVAAGVATIPAVYILGARLFDREVGLIAGALLAVNAFHVQWSQETRSYALLVLLLTLSFIYFTKSTSRLSAKQAPPMSYLRRRHCTRTSMQAWFVLRKRLRY